MTGEARFAAVDLGGTKVAVGVADAAGRLLATDAFPTRPERGPDTVIAEIAARLRALGGEAWLGAGVASVGPLDPAEGVLLAPPNFPGWDHVPLRAPLEAALGAPVRVDNDANAAALGEHRHGAGQGAEVLLYVTVSTGIGGGVVIGGRLLHGLGGAAGELGHQTLLPDGPACGCGNRGCLEAMASGTAIVRSARASIAQGAGAAILAEAGGDVAALHAGHVAAAARAGDPCATAIWGMAMEWLGIGLANAVTVLAPDRLVLGGGVTAAGPQVFEPVRRGLRAHARMVPVDRLDLRAAALGAVAGLAGAAALAVDAARARTVR